MKTETKKFLEFNGKTSSELLKAALAVQPMPGHQFSTSTIAK